jgi:hypothetical protein
LGSSPFAGRFLFPVVLASLLPWCHCQLSCIACGLDTINPVADGQNYSSDPRNLQTKMYNETCTQVKVCLHEH